MITIGETNELVCVKKVDFGAYFDGGSFGEILMPKRYEPETLNPGDKIEVFIYKDSEDRLIATTERPYLQANQIGFLKVLEVNNIGAFMDWGLPKDLLVPYREQHSELKEGQKYAVAVSLDHTTQRVIGSTKIEKFLDNVPPDYPEGTEVDLLIWQEHELGFKVIINQLHTGMLYKNEVFRSLKPGDKTKGFIKKVREDEKIDCSLTKTGYSKTEGLTDTIIKNLEENGGTLAISDKSSPEAIYNMFNCSKKAFKMALGALYKQKLIQIEPNNIRLLKNRS